jgi:transcriptional regulator with GAF, ATPase, and Fis domain
MWPGNVRELEQAVRRILLTGRYEGDKGAALQDAELDLTQTMESGGVSVQELTALYCRRLFARFGSYGEVARKTGLDWRTVKKYVEMG